MVPMERSCLIEGHMVKNNATHENHGETVDLKKKPLNFDNINKMKIMKKKPDMYWHVRKTDVNRVHVS